MNKGKHPKRKFLPSPQEMGLLTRDDIHDELKAMPYWLLHHPKDMIQASVHELREELMHIDLFLKELYEDPEISSLPIKSLRGPITVGQYCEVMQIYMTNMVKMMAVMFRYTREYPFEGDSTPEDNQGDQTSGE